MSTTSSEHCFIGKALSNLGIGHQKKEIPFLDIRIGDTIQQFKKEWDVLVPSDHLISSSSCLLYERSSSHGIGYRYAMAFADQKPVLCCVFQLVSIKPENLQSPLKSKFIKYATKLMLNLHDIKVLVVGNVFKDRSAPLHFVPKELSEVQLNQLLSKIIDQISDKECVSVVMLKDMQEKAPLPELGKLERLDSDISMEMELDPNWTSLKDYQSALSKKYAARSKKILNSAQDIEVKELGLAEIEANKTTLHALYQQVHKRQPFTFGELKQEYFPSLKKLLGDAFSIKGLFLHNRLVAFYSAISHQDELEVHYVGIDYTHNPTHNLYFYLHFLVLEQAILTKKSWLYMGRTSLEAKAILGCTPVYNATYLHFKNSLAECVFGYFKKDISEPENWKTRNPLKTQTQLEVVDK